MVLIKFKDKGKNSRQFAMGVKLVEFIEMLKAFYRIMERKAIMSDIDRQQTSGLAVLTLHHTNKI